MFCIILSMAVNTTGISISALQHPHVFSASSCPCSKIRPEMEKAALYFLCTIICPEVSRFCGSRNDASILEPDHPFFYVAYFTRFIGLLIAFSGMGSVSWKGFTGSTGRLFLACCGIAAVNILAGPYGYPDMFYITPYYPTTQPFFNDC